MPEMLKCAKCGWEWVKRRGRPEPQTCPNPECRTKLWKGDTFRGKPDERKYVPMED